jgi:hypothetical protein
LKPLAISSDAKPCRSDCNKSLPRPVIPASRMATRNASPDYRKVGAAFRAPAQLAGLDDAAGCTVCLQPFGWPRSSRRVVTSGRGRLAERGMHPDIVEIDPAETQIRVEHATAVIRETALAPVEGERWAVIVFVTAAPSELLETVRPRCLRVDLDALDSSTVLAALGASGVEGDAARLAAALDVCRDAHTALAEHNPNETILLERLVLHLQPAAVA